MHFHLVCEYCSKKSPARSSVAFLTFSPRILDVELLTLYFSVNSKIFILGVFSKKSNYIHIFLFVVQTNYNKSLSQFPVRFLSGVVSWCGNEAISTKKKILIYMSKKLNANISNVVTGEALKGN